MHSKLLVFTPDLPTMEQLADILAPYEEYKTDNNPLQWDYWEIGGRYAGEIYSKTSLFHYEGIHKFMEIKIIRNVEIISSILDELKVKDDPDDIMLSDYYRWFLDENDNFRCDGAYVRNIVNEKAFDTFAFIDLQRKAYARERFVNNHWCEFADFEKELLRARNEAANGFVTVIDIHT